MIRRILVVSAAVVVAGTTAVLATAAAADAWLDDAATPVLLGLAAVWLTQAGIGMLRGHRRPGPARQQWRCHGHALWHGRIRHHRHPAVPRTGGTL